MTVRVASSSPPMIAWSQPHIWRQRLESRELAAHYIHYGRALPRDAPVMTMTFRSDVMFALSHGRGCIRASRYTNGPNAASRRLLNCCHLLLPVRRRSCQRCAGTEQASDGESQGSAFRNSLTTAAELSDASWKKVPISFSASPPPARSDRLRNAMNGTRLAYATCATPALSMSRTS